jgi:hypothetical protein
MTASAIHRSPGKLLTTGSFVTRFAVRDSMNTGQGKSLSSVKFQYVLAILPVARRMAILACLTELTLVMITVAVDAGYAHATEYTAPVAANTLGGRMSPFERKPRFAMVKCQGIAHFGPGFRRMTALTVPFEFAVRILRCRLTNHHSGCGRKEQHKNNTDMSHDFFTF